MQICASEQRLNKTEVKFPNNSEQWRPHTALGSRCTSQYLTLDLKK